MEKVYIFKVVLNYRKGPWRRIQIKDNQTLGDFDSIIREAFNHDSWDHLSEFYSGRVWHSQGFGEINPHGGGKGAKKRINQLALSEGDKIEYVYDFGDNIQHVVTLEKIGKPEDGIKYPRITSRNKPRYRYCDHCRKEGKKTLATWVCYECSEAKEKESLLCKDCIMKEHEDHMADEILY